MVANLVAGKRAWTIPDQLVHEPLRLVIGNLGPDENVLEPFEARTYVSG